MGHTTLHIPADVPVHMHTAYQNNWNTVTRTTNDRIFLFTADHGLEHLYQDFPPTAEADATTHLFEIAQRIPIGAFVTHLGIIAQHGKQYRSIPYMIKMNAKTNSISGSQRDPRSSLLYSVDDVVTFQEESKLNICGIGLTLYLGSEYESEMLTECAQTVFHAHQAGLVAGIWVYPRGKAIKDPFSPEILTGAAGIAHSLGADFVKLQLPEEFDESLLLGIKNAASTTKVIFAGGKAINPESFLSFAEQVMQTGLCNGFAAGRNIFNHNLQKAVEIGQKLHDIIYQK